ncbi:type I-C CRISPR-associated protein Cas8c/Csd1 [Bradyrhizobium sp. SZCCHNRI3037]|uniref:type I-C CRISPR-associated protein Cas8c/Csd1 n=1 Tax=Bradyrhizobium sp. SZCCHNRI3037 TaxID=3057290 RepID=UPI002916DC21|nr:type I-C CRISPR-associated protein Cas8c/Csd1 [Bradyrhizobium sp. SZCCHNRI3037]
MSALATLVRAYEHLAAKEDVPTYGYSQEKIGFLISLNADGTPAGPPIDLRQIDGRKKTPRLMTVPAAFKRPGTTPRAFFLWDNTAYALGVTATDTKTGAARLEAFRELHKKELSQTQDEGLLALLRFVSSWTPNEFLRLGWPQEMKDQNVVFALESERREDIRIHDRPAAREIWARLSTEKVGSGICLLTGLQGPIARLHPSIKEVWGAQTSGASIVSYNLRSSESYGHQQGGNAPISESAAFAYTTALNHFLAKGSRHRIQIGNASTVFWAEAENATDAEDAVNIFKGFFAVDAQQEAGKVAHVLQAIRNCISLADVAPRLSDGVRFFVLALEPNAARLSVRFYVEDDFGLIAERYGRHVKGMSIDPSPRESMPSMWRLLVETATLKKSENIVPNLAGDWMRAILTGAPYPSTLLSTLLIRFRADHDINGLRVAIIKSVLVRNFGHSFPREIPVSLDPDNREPGYLLGRLFAVYEQIQTAALGQKLNSTIRDKFYGAAASQPRKIFPFLDKGCRLHLSKLGKSRQGYRVALEKSISEIMETMSPGDDPFPPHLPDKQQGLFALGYYHQRNHFFYRTNGKSAEEVLEDNNG